MKKPTRAAINARIEDVLRIRLDGAEFWDVREYAREKCAEDGSPWHTEGGKCLSDGQLFRYIARADKLIGESCRSSRKRLLRRHLAQRRNLYGKATNSGDVRAALACLDSEAKLVGLFDAPSKPAKNEAGTPAEVAKLLAARLQEVEAADMPATDRARLLTALADSYLRAHSVAEVEKKVDAIIERLATLEVGKKK